MVAPAERLRSWWRAREAEVFDPVGTRPHGSSLLAARVPLHLALRGSCRLFLATETQGRTGLRRAALAACAAWDVAEAVRLRRDPRLRLGPRLVTDVADVAVWSAVTTRPYASVPILGTPLITETALRHQLAAAPVVAVHLAAVAVARRLAGKPLRPANLGYQVVALACGLGMRQAERAAAERVRAGLDAERRAAATTAAIAGRYRVAAGTYVVRDRPVNPHDVLSGVRLHFPSARDAPSALRELAWGGRKGDLEALAAERAVQLDTALRAWKRQANACRSALADQVLEMCLPEGHGMTLLSGDQVARLGAALEAGRKRGAVAVRVVEASRPGAQVVLDVDGSRVELPADPPRTIVVRADPTPVAMLEGGILWALLEATEAADDAPLWSTLPGAAGFAALALWSRRALRERGEAAHPRMLALSAAAALVQAVSVHGAVRGRPDRPDGTQRLPMQVALIAPSVVAGFCWPSLDRHTRQRTGALFAALAAVGLGLLEPPRWRRDLAVNALWLPAAFLPALAYRLGSDRDAERVRAEGHARQAHAADDAARHGERSEWEQILAACDEALASADSIGPSARPTVERRLRDLHQLAEERLGAC